MVGDGRASSVGAFVEMVAPDSPDIYETVFFECLSELAGRDAAGDFQTVTTTAGDSISISGGTVLPSAMNWSTIIRTTCWMF